MHPGLYQVLISFPSGSVSLHSLQWLSHLHVAFFVPFLWLPEGAGAFSLSSGESCCSSKEAGDLSLAVEISTGYRAQHLLKCWELQCFFHNNFPRDEKAKKQGEWKRRKHGWYCWFTFMWYKACPHLHSSFLQLIWMVMIVHSNNCMCKAFPQPRTFITPISIGLYGDWCHFRDEKCNLHTFTSLIHGTKTES